MANFAASKEMQSDLQLGKTKLEVRVADLQASITGRDNQIEELRILRFWILHDHDNMEPGTVLDQQSESKFRSRKFVEQSFNSVIRFIYR